MSESLTTNKVAVAACPFCGGTDTACGIADEEFGRFWVECICGARGPTVETLKDARPAWNKRLAPEPEGWQPIETAPTDGRWFVGIYKSSKCPFVVRHDKDERMWCDTGDAYRNPTHWAALPETKAAVQPEPVKPPEPTVSSEWRGQELWWCINGDWIEDQALKNWYVNAKDEYTGPVITLKHVKAYANRLPANGGGK